jgi:hypothetical protein
MHALAAAGVCIAALLTTVAGAQETKETVSVNDAFFTPDNWRAKIELRGLEPGKYKVSDYAEGKTWAWSTRQATGLRN